MKTTQQDQVHQTAAWEARQIRPVKRNPWPRLTAVLAACLALLLGYAVSGHFAAFITGVADQLDLRRVDIDPGDRNGLNPH